MTEETKTYPGPDAYEGEWGPRELLGMLETACEALAEEVVGPVNCPKPWFPDDRKQAQEDIIRQMKIEILVGELGALLYPEAETQGEVFEHLYYYFRKLAREADCT